MKTQLRTCHILLALGGAGCLLLMAFGLRGMNGSDGAGLHRAAATRSDAESLAPSVLHSSKSSAQRSSPRRGGDPFSVTDRLDQILAAEEIDWPHLVQVYAASVENFSAGERREWAARFAESVTGASSLDPDDLRTIDRALPEFYERVAFARVVAGSMVADQFPWSEALAQSFGEAAVQEQFLVQTGRRYVQDDWEAAATWANSLPPDSSAAGWSGVLDGWAEEDPDSLLAWAEEHGLAEAAASATGKLARRLALTDAHAAVELSNGLPPSAARNQALGYALNRWASQERESVIVWADEQTDGAARGLGLLAAARVWLRSDPDAAAEWISTWEGPSALALRESALNEKGN